MLLLGQQSLPALGLDYVELQGRKQANESVKYSDFPFHYVIFSIS